jgi:streptogramin lyase
MWFAEHSSGKIGRIPVTATPTNPHITEYTSSATTFQPYGVTGGADGAIWFTENVGNRVGRIPVNATPGANSQISFFPIPGSAVTPFQIKSGPDGALWFVDSSASLYRMSLSGFVTKYPFATPSVATVGLTFTKSGDLWVTEISASIVARISAFKTPHAWTSLGGGDFDGDGNKDILWRNSAGTLIVWYMSAGAVSKAWPVSGPTADWRFAGVGDFYGDKHDSVLWQNMKDGRIMIYRFGARQIILARPMLPRMATGLQIEQVGDINLDAKADILLRDGVGTTSAWLMNGATIVSQKALPGLQ